MIFPLPYGNPSGNKKARNQTGQRTDCSVTIVLFRRFCPTVAQHCTREQQQQRQHINQTYPAQYRTLGNRYDDFIADSCIDGIFHLELAGFAAKQAGQFARPATLAIALLATVDLAGLD